MKRISRKKSLIIITLFILILAVVIEIYYETNVFKVNKVHFNSNKIPNGSSIKLIQFSDLHAKVFGKNNQKLIQTIKMSSPTLL
ncbi:hypothetical protein [Oceanobacillus sp. 1P07AA]|uniref:hypothetical protein n=1 Tax=Oceanobacillus sp. 1P07AA TaxID=3132293 RepID=UPI0039A4611A